MYPKNKNEYPSYILKDTWDEPISDLSKRQNNLVSEKWVFEKDDKTEKNAIENTEINVKDFLKIFFEYMQTHFDELNHHVPMGEKFESWWYRHSFGTSYQPIIQMCYILQGQDLGFDVREHHSQKRISELARKIHGMEYNKETKCRSYKNIDICWGKDNTSYVTENLTLALEYEDSGTIDDLFEELYGKLLYINAEFIVLGGRLNSEFDIEVISKKIENKLQKDNIERFLTFIFIAPDSISKPTKIYFAQFVYDNHKLTRIDDKKYYIEIIQKRISKGVVIRKLDHS